jgi:hypothetical protein
VPDKSAAGCCGGPRRTKEGAHFSLPETSISDGAAAVIGWCGLGSRVRQSALSRVGVGTTAGREIRSQLSPCPRLVPAPARSQHRFATSAGLWIVQGEVLEQVVRPLGGVGGEAGYSTPRGHRKKGYTDGLGWRAAVSDWPLPQPPAHLLRGAMAHATTGELLLDFEYPLRRGTPVVAPQLR